MSDQVPDAKWLEREARRHRVKVGVFLLLVRQGELLLLRRHNTGIADGRHVVPMGGLQDGETAQQALLREAQEEAGITPLNVRAAHVMHRRHRMPDGYLFPQIDLYYWAEEWEGTVTNCEPHKCDELRFYPLEALPTTIEPFIPHALKCIQANEPFSEFGWY